MPDQLKMILPQSEPVREFCQEDIHGFVGGEKLIQVIPDVETAILIVRVSGLRPYKVGRGTGHKFPADDEVGQPLVYRKFWIGEAIVHVHIPVLINLIAIVHQADLIVGINVITILESIGFGIGDHFEIRVVARGCEGLSPVLNGEIGSNVEVDTNRHAEDLLIDRPKM